MDEYEPLSISDMMTILSTAGRYWPAVNDWLDRKTEDVRRNIVVGWTNTLKQRGITKTQILRWLEQALSGAVPVNQFRPENLLHYLCSSIEPHKWYHLWVRAGSRGVCPTEITEPLARNNEVRILLKQVQPGTNRNTVTSRVQTAVHAPDVEFPDVTADSESPDNPHRQAEARMASKEASDEV